MRDDTGEFDATVRSMEPVRSAHHDAVAGYAGLRRHHPADPARRRSRRRDGDSRQQGAAGPDGSTGRRFVQAGHAGGRPGQGHRPGHAAARPVQPQTDPNPPLQAEHRVLGAQGLRAVHRRRPAPGAQRAPRRLAQTDGDQGPHLRRARRRQPLHGGHVRDGALHPQAHRADAPRDHQPAAPQQARPEPRHHRGGPGRQAGRAGVQRVSGVYRRRPGLGHRPLR